MSEKDKKNNEQNQGADNSGSLENSFYKLGIEGNIRKTFRVPVDETDNIKVVIKDIEYEVLDVASEGIGVRITKLDKFKTGDHLKQIRIIINDKTFRLEGEIIHITADTPDTSICGIKFINISPEIRKSLITYLQKHGDFDLNTVF